MPPTDSVFATNKNKRNMAKPEARKHPNLVLPIIIVIVIILMVVGIVIRGRTSRGLCTYDHVYRKVTCKAKQLRAIPTDITEGAITLHMGTKLDKQENFFTVLTPGKTKHISQKLTQLAGWE